MERAQILKLTKLDRSVQGIEVKSAPEAIVKNKVARKSIPEEESCSPRINIGHNGIILSNDYRVPYKLKIQQLSITKHDRQKSF